MVPAVPSCSVSATRARFFGEHLPPAAVTEQLAEFKRAAGGAGPQFSHTRLPIPDRSFLPVFRGVFPFSRQSGAVDKILVVLAKDSQRVR